MAESASASIYPVRFDVAGITVSIVQAPPVYAPGGPVALVFELPLKEGDDPIRRAVADLR